MDDPVRVWLADRSGDEETVVVVYATPDGSRFVRREAPAGVEVPGRSASASIRVRPDRLSRVEDPGVREVYATAVAETRKTYDADEAV